MSRRLRRPRITLSWAQSADGRIATRTGDSKYLSSPESLGLQQELRRDCGAVLVGIGTVLADDPRLLCRLGPEENPSGRQPLRVVLDSSFRTPADSVLARTAREHPVLVIGACGPVGPAGADGEARRRRSALEAAGVLTAAVPSEDPQAAHPRPALHAALALLADKGVETLFVEGGSAVLTAFLAADLADRIMLDIAPRFIGEGIPAVGDLGVLKLVEARPYRSAGAAMRGANLIWTLERP